MNLSETAEVLSAISELRSADKPMALATIVSVSGSTYRRPGARLLVPDQGESVGNLSGGCLEGQVEAVARDVMSSGEPSLEFYDLTADDEVVWGWGLGCNGAIEVFIEPAARAAEVADDLRGAIEEQRTLASATVVESSVEGVARGARVVVYPDGRHSGTTGSSEVDAELVEACMRALDDGGTQVVKVAAGDVRAFVEVLRPPMRLVVCGAGHDAIPLVRHAAGLGWRVAVVDDREAMLERSRFPGATEFIVSEPAEAAEKAAVDERSYVVVMSHNYLRDRDYLKSFIESPAAYVGMLGPIARLERLVGDLATDGIVPDEEQRSRVFGPAGLDLGAEGPEEIAAAIVAEVLAVSRGRGAGPLRERSGPIHDRAAEAERT